MYDIIRDSTFGQIVRYVTKNKCLRYAEERRGFRHPHYALEREKPETGNSAAAPSEGDGHDNASQYLSAGVNSSANYQADSAAGSSHPSDIYTESDDLEDALEPNPIERLVTQQSLHTVERSQTLVIEPTKTAEGVILVDWYTTGERLGRGRYSIPQTILILIMADDAENPQNWGRAKKAIVSFQIWYVQFTY